MRGYDIVFGYGFFFGGEQKGGIFDGLYRFEVDLRMVGLHRGILYINTSMQVFLIKGRKVYNVLSYFLTVSL